MIVAPGFAVLKIALEGVIGAGKGDIRPGNVLRIHQHGFQAFRPRPEFGLQQLCAEKHVYLQRLQHVYDRQELAALDLREGLFPSLASGALLKGFAVLHEPSRDRPKTTSRLDTAPAQKDLSLVVRDAANHEPGVLIVDGSTRVADVARQVVARRDAKFDLGAALITKIHGSGMSISRTKRWAGPLR